MKDAAVHIYIKTFPKHSKHTLCGANEYTATRNTCQSAGMWLSVDSIRNRFLWFWENPYWNFIALPLAPSSNTQNCDSSNGKQGGGGQWFCCHVYPQVYVGIELQSKTFNANAVVSSIKLRAIYSSPYVYFVIASRGIPQSDLSNPGGSAGWVLCNVHAWKDPEQRTQQQEGRRTTRKRWIRDVDEDVRMMIVGGSRVRKQDRQEWRTVREAEVHTGLQRHTWWWFSWTSFSHLLYRTCLVADGTLLHRARGWYNATREGKS